VPNGHLQAVGTDARGRRQYLYHPLWRSRRDREKHEHVLTFATRLAAARGRAQADLALPGMPRERVLATAFRLLDLGLFRIGGESYADENGSYGLATLRKDHVRITGGSVQFAYTAKSGRQRRRRHQRLPQGADRAGRVPEGFPDLACHRARGRRAGRGARGARAATFRARHTPGGHACDAGGLAAAGEHSGGLPRVLRGPARGGPVRRGRDHPEVIAAPGSRGVRRSRDPAAGRAGGAAAAARGVPGEAEHARSASG
jgi:hypothetical protein